MVLNRFTGFVACCGFLAANCAAQSGREVAVYPWVFKSGNVTSKKLLIDTVRRIAENQGLHVIAQDTAVGKYDSMRPQMAYRNNVPILPDLSRYAKATHAGTLIFGTAGWHTRSIWVGTGPKTISTITLDIYVYNAAAGKITYRKTGVEARSDEKESALKDVAALLVTPIIPMVSGGPATPREQRAAQIAVGKALLPWAKQISAR